MRVNHTDQIFPVGKDVNDDHEEDDGKVGGRQQPPKRVLRVGHAENIGKLSSLIERSEGLFLPNCQTNLVIALYTLTLLFFKFKTQQLTPWADMSSSSVSCCTP